jgi:Tfp pilus assembly protein PilN
MMRINLLPPEILERRKSEKRLSWVILAAIGIAVVLVGVWGVGYFQREAKRGELAAIQQDVQLANAQAAQLAVFESRAGELEARRATVALAFKGRIGWAKLLQELSLVLPADVWAQSLTVDQISGLQLAGYAIDAPTDSPDLGFKPMARLLVRLTDLEQLSDVWLSSSTRSSFEGQDALQFTVTAVINPPEDAQ